MALSKIIFNHKITYFEQHFDPPFQKICVINKFHNIKIMISAYSVGPEKDKISFTLMYIFIYGFGRIVVLHSDKLLYEYLSYM